MKFTQLGEFEELVLLTIGALQDNAYGVSVKNEIEDKTDRKVSIGALHSALNRLEKKGFVESKMGGAKAERGGRRKRFYTITQSGEKALLKNYRLRSDLIRLIPNISIDR
jgi:PadR family transcriptional regulator PadR